MKEKNVLIVCITLILCAVIIAATFVIVSSDNNGIPIPGVAANSTKDNSSNVAPNDTVDLSSVTFYSDGNPNTGEVATLYFGKESAGKVVEISTVYYRDGYQFNKVDYGTVSIDSDGNAKVTDTTPMNKYPDKCVITVKYNGNSFTKTANLGTYKGSQTVSL